MRLHAPSPPQGKNSRSLLFSLLPPHLQYSAPQGIGVAAFGPAMGYEPANWADGAFKQRIPLTINGGQVTTTQNDFVLLINSTFSDLIGKVEGELRIGTNELLVDYEIQDFDNTTGELIAWAKVPSISDGDVFNIYFDNPAAIDNQNPFDVWSDYSNVYHLNNVVAPNSILDSTIAQETGNPQGTILVDAKIGKGQQFDETTSPDPSRIQLLSYNPSTSVSISLWFKTVNSNRGSFFTTGNSTGVGIFCEFAANGTIRYVYRNPPAAGGGINFNSSAAFADNLFHKLVYVYNDAGDISRIFVDGVQDGNAVNTLGPQSAADSDGGLGTSSPFGFALPYTGILDEFQTFVGVLSVDRIGAEFNNQSAPDTFYSTGTVEGVPAPVDTMAYQPIWFDIDFLQRIPLTINSGQVPSPQTDFVLLINDTFSELMGEVEAELRFASTDNIQLEYEIQKFDSGTGELIAWVKKPTVSNDDIIFVYFDNPAAVDEQDAFAVWSDYNNVYHMNNVVAPNSILDSTITQEPGDPSNTTLVAAKIGNGQQFDETAIPQSGQIGFQNYDVPFSFSISMWIKTIEQSRGVLLAVSEGLPNEFPAVFTEIQTNGTIRFVYRNPPAAGGGTQITSSPTIVDDGIFHKIVFVYDDAGDNQELFIDGVSVASITNTQAPQDAATKNSVLGVTLFGSSGFPYDGIIDEFQTFVGVLSADRILAEFNNQNDQSTFYTKGAAETFPAATIRMGYET